MASSGSGDFLGVTALANGYDHSVALKNDGTVWTWGNNPYGQLGRGGCCTAASQPVQVAGTGGSGALTGIVAVAAGSSYSLVLKNDGTVLAWGHNDKGQLSR